MDHGNHAQKPVSSSIQEILHNTMNKITLNTFKTNNTVVVQFLKQTEKTHKSLIMEGQNKI